MTAAYEYEDLHHLVDRLTPAQVRRLRLLVSEDGELSRVMNAPTEGDDTGELSSADAFRPLIGSLHGPVDLGERHDYYIREHLRKKFGYRE